ncbi:MAG: hypothetical protein NTZ46_09595 [Verrucomicrobia bacterium]|nr:hypothetical protein [Verrucomicrobiota bacterium]
MRIIFVFGAISASLALAILLGSAGNSGALLAQGVGAMLLGFGLAWTTVRIHSVALKMVVAAVALLETAALSWLLQQGGITWSPYTALGAGALATVLGLIYSQSKAGRRRRCMEAVLGGRLSRETFRKFLASKSPFPFPAEKRDLSVVQCEISNRNELAAKLSAPDFIALTNAFSDVAANGLMESGGVLIGSELPRAAFGALLADPAHAAQASEAARALEERFEGFRRDCFERSGLEPNCKVIIYSGPMIVGFFESAISCGFDVVPAAE